MIWECKCGRIKSSQPNKSTIRKLWICDRCKSGTRVIFVGTHRLTLKLKAHVAKR